MRGPWEKYSTLYNNNKCIGYKKNVGPQCKIINHLDNLLNLSIDNSGSGSFAGMFYWNEDLSLNNIVQGYLKSQKAHTTLV